MQRKNAMIWRIAIVVLLQLFLSAGLFAEEPVETPEGGDKIVKEPMTRFQIAKEHHLLMQQIIDGLNEIAGILKRLAALEKNMQEQSGLDGELEALTKKMEALSEKHRLLMKAVDDLSKGTARRSPGEDHDPNANP